jgi:proline iminopeptidase
MNVSQMERDTLDVVTYLRGRFHRNKIFVLGHSWGSMLGLWLAHEHPDSLFAYVGVGQVVNFRETEQVAYRDALGEARRSHNEKAVRDLESIAPYPPPDGDLRKGQTAKNWETRLLGPKSVPTFVDGGTIVSSLISAPEYSLADDFGFLRGQLFSLETFVPQTMEIDLRKLGTDFRVPILLFEGRYDPYCRPSLVEDYIKSITAPAKELVWFENSGHFPFFEEKERFADEMVRRILPLGS